MQEIFWIDMCSDPKITGRDGHQQIGFLGEEPERLYLDDNILLPSFESEVEFVLGSKSNWTDIFYKSNGRERGVVLNQKVKAIFERYSICQHTYINIKIHGNKNNISEEYFWLILEPNCGLEYIDFNQSTFNFVEHYSVIEEVSFSNAEDFLQFKKEKCDWKYALKANTLRLKHDILPDIFTLPIDYKVFIKEKLAESMIGNKISGLDIQARPPYIYLK